MRKILISEKAIQGQHPDMIEAINQITNRHQSLIEQIASIYFLVPQFIHSVNLVRWYALYRNNGQYNKDTYFTSYN